MPPGERPSMSNDAITLREYLERILDERAKALELQAKEYERRLEDLNNAHAKAIEVQNTYIRREAYELGLDKMFARINTVVEGLDAKIESNTKDILSLGLSRANAAGRAVATSALTGILSAIIVALIIHFILG